MKRAPPPPPPLVIVFNDNVTVILHTMVYNVSLNLETLLMVWVLEEIHMLTLLYLSSKLKIYDITVQYYNFRNVHKGPKIRTLIP